MIPIIENFCLDTMGTAMFDKNMRLIQFIDGTMFIITFEVNHTSWGC